MNQQKSEFISWCLEMGVLQFGEFELKSGRISPYFFNASAFKTGEELTKLAHFYVEAILESQIEFDGLFGPAYKGIPLGTAVAQYLWNNYQFNKTVTFNRKEAKNHGEGGILFGSPLPPRVFIIDDVVTAGTAIREAIKIIRANGSQVVGVAVVIDRQEKGLDERSAIQALQEDEGIPVVPIISFSDIIMYLNEQQKSSELKSMESYRKLYGVRS